MTGRTAALLATEAFLGPIDFGAAERLVRALLACCQLPLHNALQEVGAHLFNAEDGIVEIDGTGVLRREGFDLDLHASVPSSPSAAAGAAVSASVATGAFSSSSVRNLPGTGSSASP